LTSTQATLDRWQSDILQCELKMKLLEVERGGHVLPCPIAGDATGFSQFLRPGFQDGNFVPLIYHSCGERSISYLERDRAIVDAPNAFETRRP